MSKLISITHITSVHARYDTRIFIKMCSSLATKDNYKVTLVVADGLGSETKNGVNIIDIGTSDGRRLTRMTKTTQKIFQKAKELDSHIYHLHDPELIPIGLKLKKLGKKVVFDSHENIEEDILSKEWIPLLIRKFISLAYSIYEEYTCKKFDYIITATPYIRDKFFKINKNSVDINNFPILGELSNNTPWSQKKDEVCYVGGISEIRGIKEVVKAMEITSGVRLNLVGAFSQKSLKDEVQTYTGWERVNELGFLDRDGVADVMSSSKAGIVTLHPIVNYLDSLPIKMFEYMSTGLPAIASNFPLWKEIIEGNSCGICVNPLEPKEAAKAIEYIIAHPQEAEQMGQNGKKAVIEKYNWGVEEKKLFKVYEELVK